MNNNSIKKYPMYNQEIVEIGIEWCILHNYYNIIRLYPIPDFWNAIKTIDNIFDFHLFPYEGITDYDRYLYFNKLNSEFIVGLELAIQTGSSRAFSKYLYQLITTIQSD